MPSYKLTYFNARGRAELPRLLFAAAGVEYEDERTEEFQTLKPKLPLGSLPILTVDGGQVLCQSMSIVRYLASAFGLAGKTDWDKALVDEVMESITELRLKVYATFFEKDDARKAELVQKSENEGDKILAYLEKRLTENPTNSGFFVGDSVTAADLAVFDVMEMLTSDKKDLLEKSGRERLRANNEKVSSLPRIKEWLGKRPPTKF